MGATYRKIEMGCDLEKLWIGASERKNTRTIQYPVTSLREKEPDKIARVDKNLYMHASMQRREWLMEISDATQQSSCQLILVQGCTLTASGHVS